MENTEHTKYTRLMAAVLAGILLIASIIGYIISQKMNKSGAVANHQPLTTNSAPLPTPTLIPYPTKGSLVLKETSGKPIQAGAPFTISLDATSKDLVAGYDVILSYDKANLERQSAQSLAPAFRIFTFERGGHLSISATKNVAMQEPVLFTQSPLLSFTFIAKKKGTYIFSLKAVGNESSKFVNEAAAVTYPETSDISIEIN